MQREKTPELLAITITVALVFVTFAFGSISANAATPKTPAEARYQQDRAHCLAGKATEDQKTCLKEAAAALQAARTHQLVTPDAAQLAANERKRCEPLRGDDKADCLKRVQGIDTTVTGSVEAGGDLKETVTVVPGRPAIEPETLPPTAAGPASQASSPGN